MIEVGNMRRVFWLYMVVIAVFLIVTLVVESLISLNYCVTLSHDPLPLLWHMMLFLTPGGDVECTPVFREWNWLFLGLSVLAGIWVSYRWSRFLGKVDKLTQSERSLQEALKVVNEGIFEWGFPSDRIFCSSTLFRLCGFERPGAEIDIAEMHDLIHPDDRDYDTRQISEAVQNYAVANYRIRLRHRDGHYFPVHVRGKVHSVDAFRQIYFIVGVVRDLTSDIAARQEVDQWSSRGLPGSSEGEGVCELSCPGLVIRRNFSPKVHFQNFPLDELVNRPLSQLLERKAFEELSRWVREPDDPGKEHMPFQLDAVIEPCEGPALPVRMIFIKSFQERNRIVILRIRDLSGENNVNINTIILQQAIDRLVVGLVIVKMDGSICYSNRSAKQTVPELDEAGYVAGVVPELSERRFRLLASRVRRKGGTDFYFPFRGNSYEVNAGYLNTGAGYVCFLLRDRTRFQVKVLEMNQALVHEQQANRKRLSLLNSINYELRKPLTGILGFADLLRDPSLSGEEREDYLQMIISSGNRLLNLWTGVLELTTLECGEVELRLESVNLNSVLNSIETSYSTRIPPNIQFRIQKTSRDVDANIVSDASILLQIFDKLLDNAIKFTSAGWIEVGYMIEDKVVNFYVADSGCGIADELKSEIFDPFQKDILLRRVDPDSVGMGLPIVKRQIELLKGCVSIQDTPGGGTRIRFSVPVDPKYPLEKCK